MARAKRAKKRKGRRRFSLSRKGRRAPKPLGITGKLGIAIIGVIPFLMSLLSAIAAVARVGELKQAEIVDKIHWGLARFLNELSMGYIGREAIPKVRTPAGAITVGAETPKFAWWTTTAVGFSMLVSDRVASKITGGRARKLPFTNINVIGAS